MTTTPLALTQQALCELWEFVQDCLEDSDGPYPIADYVNGPEVKEAARRAAQRYMKGAL